MGWPGRVRGACRRQRASRDPAAHPPALRGQERPLRLRSLQAGSWQGLWRLPSRDRGERDPKRGKPDQAADPHHPAGHREAPSLGSHPYLIFFVCILKKFFNQKKKKKKKKKKK